MYLFLSTVGFFILGVDFKSSILFYLFEQFNFFYSPNYVTKNMNITRNAHKNKRHFKFYAKTRRRFKIMLLMSNFQVFFIN